MYITKENGEREEFREVKLRTSLTRAGAPRELVNEIVAHVLSELEEDMTTTEIYRHAFNLLQRGSDKPIAARYSLKRAIMELGPSGFPFESYLAELFRARGYTAESRIRLEGKCATHEIDMVAENDSELIVAEAKFHNTAGFQTDLKTALYVEARWRDLVATGFDGRARAGLKTSFMLITNTKFSRNALRFAKCAGLGLLGWSYPEEESLEMLIEKYMLHPLTCLTTLSQTDKQTLFDKGYVLCRDVMGAESRLRSIGIGKEKAALALREAELLCPATPEAL